MTFNEAKAEDVFWDYPLLPPEMTEATCVTCHDVHGSNHARMLNQKAPNLCWNCHLTGSGHFGSGDKFSTEKGVPVAPPGSPSGYPTVNSRFIERSCRTCHVKIHGTNHPSGAYFVR